MGQGKYNFDHVAPDPTRESVQPLRGLGLPVGAIRTKPKEKQFCECEKPEPRDPEAVRIYSFVEGRGVVELRSCKACGLPIR